jgi:DNA-binding transcriptional MerR regulator
VGELATATGLTVRTLHYYEQIGLLVATARSDAGHRLYADTDVERLYRICLLRRLGLPLNEIGRALDDPAWSLRAAMATQLSDLDQRLEAAGRLRSRLVALMRSTTSTPTSVTLRSRAQPFSTSRWTSRTATASTARATAKVGCGRS